jgi:hypothetical protein
MMQNALVIPQNQPTDITSHMYPIEQNQMVATVLVCRGV